MKSTKKNVILENKNLLFLGKSNIEKYLEGINQLTINVYTKKTFVEMLKTGIDEEEYTSYSGVRDVLKSILHINPEIEQVRFYSDVNKSILSVSRNVVHFTKQVDSADYKNFEAVRSSPSRIHLHSARQAEQTDVNRQDSYASSEVISFYRVLSDVPSVVPLGFLSIDFPIRTIKQYTDKLNEPYGDQLYIISNAGQVIYHSGESGAMDWLPAIKASATAEGSLDWRNDSFNGIILYEKFSQPFDDLILVKLMPYDHLYKNARDQLNMNLIIGTIATVLIILATLFVSIRITSPIRILLRNIRKIDKGVLEVDFTTLGEDEIGILAQRFKLMIDRIKTLLFHEYKLEIQNKTNQLKVLQSQLNPHFLHNAMQSIGSLAVDRGVPEVYKLIQSLSSMLRYSMNTSEDFTLISKEMEYVESYLHLQKERFDTDLLLSIEVAEEALNCFIPKMLIQPIVENYFKHAFDHSRKPGELGICISLFDPSTLEIQVFDNGPGIEHAHLVHIVALLREENLHKQIKGIGLMNIYQRLKLYFNDKMSFELENRSEGGLQIKIHLPIILSIPEEVHHESVDRG